MEIGSEIVEMSAVVLTSIGDVRTGRRVHVPGFPALPSQWTHPLGPWQTGSNYQLGVEWEGIPFWRVRLVGKVGPSISSWDLQRQLHY